jgi:hypothetical protein
MMALVGLFLTAKFINMSVVALWQVNAIGLTIVMAWWLRALLEQVPSQWPATFLFASASAGPVLRHVVPRTVAAFAAGLALVGFLGTIEDLRNPSLYAIASYRTHPTLANYLFGGPVLLPCPPDRTGCASVPVSPQDVALIQGLTKPGERVALLAFQDWPTLIEAKRASKFHFLPSALVFTERQMRESLRDLDLIFLPLQPADKLGVSHPDMTPILVPMLREHFRVVGETPTLVAWRRIGGDGKFESEAPVRR